MTTPLKKNYFPFVMMQEIRCYHPGVLEFMTTLFPCAKFVVGFRENTEDQAHSAFWASYKEAEPAALARVNKNIYRFSEKSFKQDCICNAPGEFLKSNELE